MFKKMRYLVVIVLYFCLVESIHRQYKKHRIYQVIPRTTGEVKELIKLSREQHEFDFLTHSGIPNEPVRVIVSPDRYCHFERFLHERWISYKIINRDLSETIREQLSPEPRGWFSSSGEIKFNKYYTYDEINKYLKKLAEDYPDRVKIEEIGKSYEGRAINAITISDGVVSSSKRVILIDATIHAREWLAPTTALYIIKELVENFENNRRLLINTNWVVIPVLNPDGYVYSHKKKRLWRKTRKPNTNPKCPGTDANRNFDHKWGIDENTHSECRESYCGSNAFSEPETRAMRDLMIKLKDTCKFYVTLHSFGRYIFLPWSWDWFPPSSYVLMHEVAVVGSQAILSKKKQTFRVRRPMEVLYNVAGCSMDYAHGVVGIPVTITMELAPGGMGFDPSKRELKGFAEEGWIGIKAMAEKIQELFPL